MGFPKINRQALEKKLYALKISYGCSLIARCLGVFTTQGIFDNSGLCAQFEHGDINGMLLGDAGYATHYVLLIHNSTSIVFLSGDKTAKLIYYYSRD